MRIFKELLSIVIKIVDDLLKNRYYCRFDRLYSGCEDYLYSVCSQRSFSSLSEFYRATGFVGDVDLP